MTAPAGHVALELPPETTGRAVAGLRRALARALRADTDVVVDCRRVRSLSPGAQALLVAASRTARLRGRRVVLAQAGPEVSEALRATGLRHLLGA